MAVSITQREISQTYSFLSKTIYDELLEVGVDSEAIFTLGFYFYISVIKEFLQMTKGNEHRLNLLENTTEHKSDEDNEALALTLFRENRESLFVIIDDVYSLNMTSDFVSIYAWKDLCRKLYSTKSNETKVCFFLIQAI